VCVFCCGSVNSLLGECKFFVGGVKVLCWGSVSSFLEGCEFF